MKNNSGKTWVINVGIDKTFTIPNFFNPKIKTLIEEKIKELEEEFKNL